MRGKLIVAIATWAVLGAVGCGDGRSQRDVDASAERDAGRVGTLDAGGDRADGEVARVDARTSLVDAASSADAMTSAPDASTSGDAGDGAITVDAGVHPDGGPPADAALAEPPDAGATLLDAGPMDAGFDAGPVAPADAGPTDAGPTDAGPPPPEDLLAADPDPAAAALAAGIAVEDIALLLEVANTASYDELFWLGLPVFTQVSIVEGRELPPTGMTPYRSVGRLDRRDYVGADVMQRLVNYGKGKRERASTEGCVEPAMADVLNGRSRSFYDPDPVAWPIAVSGGEVGDPVWLIGSSFTSHQLVAARIYAMSGPTTATWTALPGTAAAPAAWYGFSAALDPVTRQPLVIGGFNAPTGDSRSAVTYRWEPSVGYVAAATQSELALTYATMTNDASRGRVVVFGGSHASGWRDHVWEWDGGSWSRRIPAAGSPVPEPRILAAAAYDPTRREVVIAGGVSPSNTPLRDVWSWNGTRFSRLPDLPEGIVGAALGYEASHHRLVLAGGARVRPVGTTTWDGIRVQREAVLVLPDGVMSWQRVGSALGYLTGPDRMLAEPTTGTMLLPSGDQVVSLDAVAATNNAPTLTELGTAPRRLRADDADFDPLQWRVTGFGTGAPWTSLRSGATFTVSASTPPGAARTFDVVLSDGRACAKRTYTATGSINVGSPGPTTRRSGDFLLDCGSSARLTANCTATVSTLGRIATCTLDGGNFWGAIAEPTSLSVPYERTVSMNVVEVTRAGDVGRNATVDVFEDVTFLADRTYVSVAMTRGGATCRGSAAFE